MVAARAAPEKPIWCLQRFLRHHDRDPADEVSAMAHNFAADRHPFVGMGVLGLVSLIY
jgi:hypothetical protein